jgi:hypothetical protein
MSEEVQAEVETNPIEDMINYAIDQNFNKANNLFNDMVTIKMSDLLDQEKINVANQMYNGAEPDDEDDEDLMGDEDDSQLELDLDSESGDEEEEDSEWEDASFEEDGQDEDVN